MADDGRPAEGLAGAAAEGAGRPAGGMFLVQEPEAQEEAEGWEFVDPSRQGASQRSGGIANLLERQWSPAGGEASEDLVMGCLHADCKAHFGDKCERQQCASCRLFFCGRHILALAAAPPRRRSPTGEALPAASAPLPAERLGLPLSVDVLALCPLCHETFRPAVVAATQTVALGPAPAGAPEPTTPAPPAPGAAPPPGATPGATPAPGGRVDVAAIAMEARRLQSLSSVNMVTPSDGEDPHRTVARALLMRLLVRLRGCLHPWSDSERAWLLRMREELCAADSGWIAQFAMQANWSSADEVKDIAALVERAQSQSRLSARDAVHILSILGRNAEAAEAILGERLLILVATRVARSFAALPETEVACVLELLLDAAHSFGFQAARSIVGTLIDAATSSSGASSALRGELFWALEARARALPAARAGAASAALALAAPGGGDGGVCAAAAAVEPGVWASASLQELLGRLPPEEELALLRQRAWVSCLESGQHMAAGVDSWGEGRSFPLAVWQPDRVCLGMAGHPRETSSKNAPVIVRCPWRAQRPRAVAAAPAAEKGAPRPAPPASEAEAAAQPPTQDMGSSMAAASSESSWMETTLPEAPTSGEAGLLVKRDSGMHMEHSVGQMLRLLELYIWEDAELQRLLQKESLNQEDVRVTYVIAMTGPNTAIVEFVEGAKTLRDVREGNGRQASAKAKASSFFSADRCTFRLYLGQHNDDAELPRALARLAFTSAVSAVLSFVAGLGDRHFENFMLTSDGRLLHVDYGYALGREPVDSMLIHMVSGGRPAALLQYEELMEALDARLLNRIFWPTVRRAFAAIRRRTGLLTEIIATAIARDPSQRHARSDSAAVWATAKAFVNRRCVPWMEEPAAQQFAFNLLRHCARHEDGARLRDSFKSLKVGKRASEVGSRVLHASLTATSAVSFAAQESSAGLWRSVKSLWQEGAGRPEEDRVRLRR